MLGRVAERHFTTPWDRTRGFEIENIFDLFSYATKVKITTFYVRLVAQFLTKM